MILKCEKLSLQRSNKLLWHNLTVQFNLGEVWGILGSNGSGKTTLLHCLAGLIEEHYENISINGRNFHKINSFTRAQQISLLLQEPEQSLPGNVYDMLLAARYAQQKNWLYYSALDKQQVVNALKSLDLLEFAKRPLSNLSSGERQRVQIARLLCQQPSIYLLDEPINHLDICYQIQALDLFQQLAKQDQKIVIISLHDINVAARYCDRLLMIFDNGVWLSGTTDELLTAENLRNLYKQDFVAVPYKKGNLWIADSHLH